MIYNSDAMEQMKNPLSPKDGKRKLFKMVAEEYN